LLAAKPTDAPPAGLDPNLARKHAVDNGLVAGRELLCGIKTRLFKPGFVIPRDRYSLAVELVTTLKHLFDRQIARLLLRSTPAQ
jgi:hypothetical protein